MNIGVTLNLLGALDIKLSNLTVAAPPDTTVALLIDLIDEHNPGFRTGIRSPKGDISPQFIFFINGRNAANLDGAKTRLNDGDVVNVIPAIAGG